MDPLVVRCRICGEELQLSIDSAEARQQRTDPRQQMRVHLQQHMTQAVNFSRFSGWLIDMLLFACPADPDRWRRSIDAVVDTILSLPPGEVRYLEWTNPTSKTESSES